MANGSIVVIHRDLNKLGGGEAICLNVIESLRSEYDIILLTGNETVNWEELNDYFGFQIESISHESIRTYGVPIDKFLRQLAGVSLWPLSYFSSRIGHAIFHRNARKAIPDCDLAICTWDELSTKDRCILYIHGPNRYKSLLPGPPQESNHLKSYLATLLNKIILVYSQFEPDQVLNQRLLTNSEWSASEIESIYDKRPEVVYPPINTEDLHPSRRWENRENGFIFLSRITPGKNVLDIIDVVAEIKSQGYDVHLHIIGPNDIDTPKYISKVESKIENMDFVYHEGPLYGEELAWMLRNHKYGINGAWNEQFGMAIAEMVAAGMIPFVPNAGGQREIVNYEPNVLFNCFDEAVQKIEKVYANDDMAGEIRSNFPDVEEQFGKKRFQQRIREIVAEEIEIE